MAEEFVRLVKIGIDKSFVNESIVNADKLAKSIAEINKIKKEEGQLSAEQEGRLKALTAERNKNIQVVKQANLLASEQVKGQEQLKAQLSILTAQYNKLTTEEQKNTKEGQALQKQILGITEELKANEKAVGNNRRNVGNYRDDIEDALEATSAFGGGLSGMVTGLKSATAASLKFLATPIGAAIGALALAVGAVTGLFKLFSESLNRTEEGSAALAKVTQTFSAIMNGVLKVLEPLATSVMQGVADGFDSIGKAAKTASGFIEDGLRFFGLEDAANGVNDFNSAIEESVKGTRQLADAQVELNKITREQSKLQLDFQNRAEKLRQIRDDESLSIKERMAANKELGQVLEEQATRELELANRALEVQKLRAQVEGESTENLDAIAAAEEKILEIEERITGQRSEQLVNVNSLIRDQRTLLKEAATEKQKSTDAEIKEEQERVKAIEQSYIEERSLIDEVSELKKAQAVINISNAEQQAEAIAFIEREALLEKLRSIEDETAAYTASADAIGAVDEKKYAKQLAERAKYEAELIAMDRAAKAEQFINQAELLSGQEQLEIEAAELSISNETELQNKKYQIALEYAQKRLALMREEAMLDDILTEKEKQNLQSVENEIKRIQQELANPDAPSVSQSLGLSDEDIEKIQLGLAVVSQTLQSVQQATQQAADNRLAEIDQRTQAEISAIEKSGDSEKKKEEKITMVEKKAAKERYKIELAQFKTAKALQIGLAIANTATAVMAQLSNPTPYAGFVLAALAAATGAIQIATIASQKPPPPPQFAKGGYVSGAGTGTSDSISARLSNGESVNNAKTTAMFAPVLSAMNKAGGGVDWYKGEGFSRGGIVKKFAAGGIAMSSQAIMRENEATREVQQTIINTPPVLVLEDFQSVQGRQVRTEQNLQL